MISPGCDPLKGTDPQEFANFQEEFQKKVDELVRKHHLDIEQLTAEQTVEVFRKAIECGDFQRYIRVDTDAQCVVYLPYSEAERLRTRIEILENLLKEHEIEYPKFCDFHHY